MTADDESLYRELVVLTDTIADLRRRIAVIAAELAVSDRALQFGGSRFARVEVALLESAIDRGTRELTELVQICVEAELARSAQFMS